MKSKGMKNMAINGTMTLNGADYAPFNLYGVGTFMAHSGQGLTVIKALVAQYKVQAQFPRVNIGLSIEAREVFILIKGSGSGPVEQNSIRCRIWP